MSAFSRAQWASWWPSGQWRGRNGVGWHKAGRCLAPSFILSLPAYVPEAVTLIPQPSGAMSPGATSPGGLSWLTLLSVLVTRAVGTLSTHPQFRATLT